MILEDKKLYRQLNASNFDLAIVDLIANECRFLLKDILDSFGYKQIGPRLFKLSLVQILPSQYSKDKFNL